jgi:hypothetical protein
VEVNSEHKGWIQNKNNLESFHGRGKIVVGTYKKRRGRY